MSLLASGSIRIRVDAHDDQQFVIDAPAVEGYVIGRSDVSHHYTPDIDLAGLPAREMGVSRRHAALIRYRGIVHVIDMESINGTFINDKRVQPDEPSPLSAGDRLRLGQLTLIIETAEPVVNR
mgnify:CR=1 FL=1